MSDRMKEILTGVVVFGVLAIVTASALLSAYYAKKVSDRKPVVIKEFVIVVEPEHEDGVYDLLGEFMRTEDK